MRELEKEDLEFDEQVGSLKEQAEQLTKKLKKLYANYQTKKAERDSLNEEFQARPAASGAAALLVLRG